MPSFVLRLHWQLQQPVLPARARGHRGQRVDCSLPSTNKHRQHALDRRTDKDQMQARDTAHTHSHWWVGKGHALRHPPRLTACATPTSPTEKNEALAKRSRREVASLLEVGKTETARIRTESLILQDTHNELSVNECAPGAGLGAGQARGRLSRPGQTAAAKAGTGFKRGIVPLCTARQYPCSLLDKACLHAAEPHRLAGPVVLQHPRPAPPCWH